MRFGPIEVRLELPAIDDVANKIHVVARVRLKETQ